MAEYIEREWLIKHINTGMNVLEVLQTIIDAPTVQPKRKTARWDAECYIERLIASYEETYCENCRNCECDICPNCGGWIHGGDK